MFLAEYTEEEWEEINREHYTNDMKYKHDYDTLITKHNESKAFSIILESINGLKYQHLKYWAIAKKLLIF
ncbi:hypothetical protein MHJ97_01980 [Macrococcus epidermidis]|uniref:hypothetical protein n=1 Tax=Macrococcus epidermidis TaxID=1902580 RepID=UPI001EF2C74D|nr:hypothetical protein [Macrococcus epidermidis]MCG7419204.1 hypothetical protein [Macrococcus epidermidis]